MPDNINSTITDEELVRLLKAGHRPAFDNIFNKYWSRLYIAAFNLLNNREAAEDIVQEVLVQLWLKRENLEIAHLNAFLYAAIRYKVFDAIRAGKLRENPGARPMPTTPEAAANATEDRLAEKELRQLLQHHIASLPEKCRQIFILSRDAQLSTREIAQLLGLAPKTVENQLTIAIRRLRASLEHYLHIAVILLSLLLR
ncbi:RNA polymerase sigma-70 factor [Chitinophaga agrisoli]|uniref:RNA polymerase sigma-70 factor n=1 Tax=Chitinophaga agrisoli TaxID=2607653 RepID=A0A5B2VMH2_9BACT|nr:RNA polymerase sigma-70 factor [Chitinophaga agrisoli]KAA2239850.1 RNA polymerase sigma-70 factor [Chitinophaga agrisoli]